MLHFTFEMQCNDSQIESFKDIRFPNISAKSIIDTLIGIDYVNLHCAKNKN